MNPPAHLLRDRAVLNALEAHERECGIRHVSEARVIIPEATPQQQADIRQRALERAICERPDIPRAELELMPLHELADVIHGGSIRIRSSRATVHGDGWTVTLKRSRKTEGAKL